MGQAIISEPDGVKSGEANHHRDEVYYQENAGWLEWRRMHVQKRVFIIRKLKTGRQSKAADNNCNEEQAKDWARHKQAKQYRSQNTEQESGEQRDNKAQ